jgi:hypothetical protein
MAKLKYSLRTLMLVVFVCAVAALVIPEVWALVTETAAGRRVAASALVGGMVLAIVIVVAMGFRLIAAATGNVAEPAQDKRGDVRNEAP